MMGSTAPLLRCSLRRLRGSSSPRAPFLGRLTRPRSVAIVASFLRLTASRAFVKTTRTAAKPQNRRGSPEAIEKRRVARLFNDILGGRGAGAHKQDGRTEKRRQRLLRELEQGKVRGARELKPLDVLGRVHELLELGEPLQLHSQGGQGAQGDPRAAGGDGRGREPAAQGLRLPARVLPVRRRRRRGAPHRGRARRPQGCRAAVSSKSRGA